MYMCVCAWLNACPFPHPHVVHHLPRVRDGDHFGMFPVFILGNVLSLASGILVVSRLGPRVLSKTYALMTAPCCVPWKPWMSRWPLVSKRWVDPG